MAVLLFNASDVPKPISFLKGISDVTGSVGTALTSSFLLSHIPQGGIELGSQKLLFNTVDTITGFTDSAGRLTQKATTGVLGGLPVFGELNSPTFNVLNAGENVRNGNLGFAFNDVGVNGKFNGVSLSKTLDVLGRGFFFAQSGIQLFDLGVNVYDDINNSDTGNISSLSSDTLRQAGQTTIDIAFGAVGTFGGLPGAGIALTYAYREELLDASKVNFENQVKENQFNINNNLPPRIGAKF